MSYPGSTGPPKDAHQPMLMITSPAANVTSPATSATRVFIAGQSTTDVK